MSFFVDLLGVLRTSTQASSLSASVMPEKASTWACTILIVGGDVGRAGISGGTGGATGGMVGGGNTIGGGSGMSGGVDNAKGSSGVGDCLSGAIGDSGRCGGGTGASPDFGAKDWGVHDPNGWPRSTTVMPSGGSRRRSAWSGEGNQSSRSSSRGRDNHCHLGMG